MHSKDITIIIPSKNRSNNLIKLANYYLTAGFQGDILMLDASEKQETLNLQNSLSKFKNIRILHTPVDYFIAVSRSLDHIKTKYVACTGDDDFLFIKGLIDCKCFLEKEQSFGGVSGLGILGVYDNDRDVISKFSIYHIEKYIDKKKGDRLKKIINTYSVINFCLHRTSLFKKAFIEYPDEIHPSKYELFNSFLFILNEKIGKISSFYILRLSHKFNKKFPDNLNYYNDNFIKFFELKIFSQLPEDFRIRIKNKEFFFKNLLNKLKDKHKKTSYFSHLVKMIFLRIRYPKYFKLFFLKNKKLSFGKVNSISRIIS